ncbi:MAG: hypothetical protein Q8941_10990 [Bacteroidota bacterium]|nr:hypothetical protein [Bacteroidota bacterium]
MIISPFKKKILRIIAYVLGSVAALLIGFHFWFINHAERLLEDLVESQSNGKIKLHVKKFKFNWFSYDMQLRNAVFYSTDTTASTSYRFNVEKIHVRVKEIFPLIFEKKMVFDSLHLLNPDIQVTRLRSKNTDTARDKNISLTQEMGKVYNSIQDALRVLKVKQFVIDHGKFTLANKTQPDELPVTITNINLHLDNLRVDTSETSGKQKIFFSDNIALQTRNQDIFFPDGRHSLSFRSFGINLLKKRVEFDSCTIAASKGDSARSSFKIFFDKLQLTNIDFDTLYQKEVIKADSVYCINPRFRLDVELEKKTGKKKPPPKLRDLIQQLTGDMQLAFVVVNNASFDINTLREGKPSSFTSDHNNFEMQGLRIEKKSPNPLTVKSFAMAIRNYENFLRDSAYAMEFDSVLLINNSIYLDNFSFKQMQDNTVINSFNIPRFELKGLSWDDLVFERTLAAEKATLYRPVINYSVTAGNHRQNKNQDIFQTLAGIGNIIQLDNLDIANGQINADFKGGAHLHLENANLSLLSKQLTAANRMDDLQQSVSRLRFKNGSLTMGDLTAKMEDADFSGKDGHLTAGAMHLTTNKKNLTINAKEVGINSMQIDNNSSTTEISGLHWKEADVQITGPATQKNIARGFLLRKIQGANTTFTTLAGNQTLSTFFETLSADELALQAGNKARVINLNAAGKNFAFANGNLRLNIDHFLFSDNRNADLQNLRFISNTATDSVSVFIPSLAFSTDVNSIIRGSITTGNVNISHPVIILKSHPKENIKRKDLPEMVADKITVQQPSLSFKRPGQNGLSKIEWRSKEEKNNSFELTNFKIGAGSSITADQLFFSSHDFSFTAGEKTFNAGDGEVNARINQFMLKPAETGEWDWQGTINDLQAKNFLFDISGTHPGQLKINSVRLDNLAISSSSILHTRQLLKENTAFRLKEITGKYTNEKNRFDWQNASYDHLSKTVTADSFSLHPLLSKEDFIAGQKYQADYLALRTGAISAGSFDITKYLDDTIIDAATVTIHDAVLADFRDKRLPFQKGIIKPLPTDLLKKIPVKLSIGMIAVDNADIEYAELNEKTNQTGTVRINRMNARVTYARNYDHHPGDSLHIHAQAFLMDSAKMQLDLRESYKDSLAGFLLVAGIGPANGKILNPVLVPLASVQLESGRLDTLSMVITGGEYLATGEMKMFYHDLKIKFLNNKGEKKKSRYKGFASFLANTFIIKNNNRVRTGTVFFERLRDKSSLNYLVKITLSGISSSIGIKNNERLLRRYKKEVHKRNL